MEEVRKEARERGQEAAGRELVSEDREDAERLCFFNSSYIDCFTPRSTSLR